MEKKNILSKVLKVLLIIFLILVLVVGIYVAYVFISYSRIEDNRVLEVEDNIGSTVPAGEELKMISYNIGFAAYTPDFGFFMDGGKESRAKSEESVNEVLKGISEFLENEDADFVLMEEIDTDSTRSYHVNEKQILVDAFKGYDSVFAENYHSSYLFYPILSPHGKSNSGMLTFSRYNIESGLRRSLPIEDGFMKMLDLDRCYSVSRLPVSNGKSLVIYTLHLSAYTSDGSVATEQLKILISDMTKECEKGNYCIAGGDFNKDLLGNSGEIFGIDGSDFTWAQPIDMDLFKNTDLHLVTPFDEDKQIPSCRNADGPYNENQFVLTVDGFIVSNNVTVTSSDVYDLGFKYSDHNPVYMSFILEK